LKRFLTNPYALMFIVFMAYQAMLNYRYIGPVEWFMEKLILLPGIVIGISFHEFAHAFTANLCGDPTPKYQNRVTLNPAAHIDPTGFIAFILIGFGWGRPVVINPQNFKRPRLNELFVALAGVTLNLILTCIFIILTRLLFVFAPGFMLSELGAILYAILESAALMNVVLMVFNLLPIPPLDGFNVITQVFNLRNTEFYYRVYDKGFLILMVFILLGLTRKVLTPIIIWIYSGLWSLLF
jgi:Zn-dependent protease